MVPVIGRNSTNKFTENVDLTIILFRASEEDIDIIAQSLLSLPNPLAWPSAWPTNAFAIKSVHYLLKGLSNAFPDRIITPPIPFVNSIFAMNLVAPSTAVRVRLSIPCPIITIAIATLSTTPTRSRKQARQG